jgi:4-diphosphocytidyl-2-C-methyl-D-erythritol kinase
MISLKAWAKINIGLKILNKRNDGFHNLETTLTTINLADFLDIEEIESGIIIESEGLNIKPEGNLCYKAADIFKRRFNINKGVKIKLIKNIPVGGGLGGGSADAACVLKGMNELFSLNVSNEELMDLSKKIGSDVPFFIKGGAAYARGRGDELQFFKLPRMSLILYYPGYPISTKGAYEAYDEYILTPRPEADNIIEKNDKKKKKLKKIFALENDFEKVVFKKHPDLGDVKAHLIVTGAFSVSLSGSGSCLFVVIDENVKKKVIKYLEGIGAQYFEGVTI